MPRGRRGEWTFSAATKQEPSLQAKAGLIVSLLNSAGLMGLGAYCIKDAIDAHSVAHVAASGSALLLGLVSLFLPFIAFRGRVR